MCAVIDIAQPLRDKKWEMPGKFLGNSQFPSFIRKGVVPHKSAYKETVWTCLLMVKNGFIEE